MILGPKSEELKIARECVCRFTTFHQMTIPQMTFDQKCNKSKTHCAHGLKSFIALGHGILNEEEA
jgi:hypothetical protein